MRRLCSLLLLPVGGLVVLAGCSRAPAFDREQAIAMVLRTDPGLQRAQAECYVDRVAAELGPGLLAAGAEPAPEQVTRLTGIRVDCIGVANLGTSPAPTAPPTAVDGAPDETVPRPTGPGDDPRLDQLYRRCAAGDGGACDALFEDAPVGSAYEEFASTCGGRTRELRCADAYPGAAAPTTAPTTVPTPTTVPATTTTARRRTR